MTHPELIRLEQLVNRLLDGMETRGEDACADLVNAAREYAESCALVNSRLQICLDILGRGKDKEHQALMAATRAPDLLDTCAVLSELQTDEFSQFCSANHLPRPERLNERAKQAIDPLYARAGSFQKKLRMELSAANSRRDFRAALEIARQLAKVDPADVAAAKQASSLEERLVREVIQKEIAPALDKGDEESAAAAVSRIEEIAPERSPRSGDRFEVEWNEALVIRQRLRKEEAIRECSNFLLLAEAARDSENLELVLEILGRINAARELHSFELSSDKEILRADLEAWKSAALRRAREEADFQAGLKELGSLLKKIGDKEFQNTPPGYEENREDALELQRLWKEIAEFRKPVEGELQDRARKILGDLTGKIDRHRHAKRRNLILASSGAATLLIIAAVTTIMFLRAGGMSEKIRESRVDGRAEDLADHLARLEEESPVWMGLGSLPRERENARTWLGEQSALAARLTGVVGSIREEIDSQPDTTVWSPLSLRALRKRIDETESELEGLNRDARIPLDDAITSLHLGWDRLVEEKRKDMIMVFGSRVEELDLMIRKELQFGRPIAELSLSITDVSQKIIEMEGLASSELEELHPSTTDLARFEVLTAKFEEFDGELKTVQEIFSKCQGAENLAAYSKAVRGLNETKLLNGQDKISLGKLVVAADSEDRLFREILMPGEIIKWNHLVERAFDGDGYPKDIAENEELVYLSLRDDESLNEMYLYDVVEGGRRRVIYSKGATLRQNYDGVQKMLTISGEDVYDPSGGSLSRIVFQEKKYLSNPEGQGTKPANERLSPESRFFQSLNFSKLVDGQFTTFQRPGLELASEVLDAPEEVSPVFRAFLFQSLGKFMRSRPEKWLIDFCDFGSDLTELDAILKTGLSPTDWCSSEVQNRLNEPLGEFFRKRRGAQYLKEARALHGFFARVHTGGLVFGGYVDQNGEKVLLSDSESHSLLWGLDTDGSVVKAYRKLPDGTWNTVKPVAKFSPIFFLRIDPAAAWQASAEACFVDPTNPKLLQKLPATFDFQQSAP